MITIKVQGEVVRLIKNQKQPCKNREGSWSSDYIILKCDPFMTKYGEESDYIPIEVYSANNSKPYYMNEVAVGDYCEFDLYLRFKNIKAPDIEIRSYIQKNNVTKRTANIFISATIKDMTTLRKNDIGDREAKNKKFDDTLPF